MTVEEIDAVLAANDWTEDKVITQARLQDDDTGVEAWRHHSMIARYLIADGQTIKDANMNANGYMVAVFQIDTTGPPANLG